MYRSIPKVPIPSPPPLRAIPGHLTRVKLCIVGNLTQNEACPVGHLTFLSKRLSAVGNKKICDSLLQHMSRVHRSLLLSIPCGFFFLLLLFYIVISWYMSLFKAWREDNLNKKFVVAENFAELVSKGKRFSLFISKGKRFCFPWRVRDLTLFEALTGGAFDLLHWQHSREFDQNSLKKSNAWGFARGGGGGMGGFGNDRYIRATKATFQLLQGTTSTLSFLPGHSPGSFTTVITIIMSFFDIFIFQEGLCSWKITPFCFQFRSLIVIAVKDNKCSIFSH